MPGDIISEIETVVMSRNGKHEKNEIRFLCPSHDDHNPSARWNMERHVWHCDVCKAGGGWKDLAGRLGIDVQSEKYNNNEIVATYDYTDADGKLLYQVCRTTGKKFFQRRPDGKGGWTNGLGGIQPVLYRLPEVLKAVQQGKTIFIPEGERDVNNLTQLGLAATTNPMGAGKWRDYYSDRLKGADVIVLPDADEPGRKHAQQVAQSLYGRAASVKVVELPGLPEKGDVSDWLAAGGTKEELLELVQECPAWKQEGAATPVIVQLSEIKPEEVSWLWEPYIPLGKLTILEGDPGVGKTWLALQLAAIVSKGDPFPGPDGVPRDRREPATVVYMTAEDGLGDTLRPRLDKAGADVSRVFALTGWEGVNPETGEKRTGGVTLADLPVIEATLKQVKPVLLVVDPLQAYLGAGVDMHRANEVRPILAGLAALAEKYKSAVLCIRHLGKSQQDRSIYRGLGSIDFSAAARSVLLVGKDPNNPRKRILAQHKCSLAAEGTSIAFELREDGFFWCGMSDVTAEALLAPAKTEEEKTALEEAEGWLRDMLADGPVESVEVLRAAKKAGIAERTLHRAKASLSVASQKIGKAWVWNLAMNDENDESYKDTSVGNLGNVDFPPTVPTGSGYDSTLPRGKLDLYPESLLPQDLEGRLPTLPSNVPLEKNFQDDRDGNLNQDNEEVF